ncbi:DUF1592 domain-containing protein [Sorangium sp. So ce1078]|uniref:DUF1592 domain-containing protein n=1 Tax=Sorangium sp. So ce1078 TaxID=3133329 RepID=UPI003F613A83
MVKLSVHETASELSFFLTDSLPGAELAAADSGALNDPEELTRQAERLLEKPETRRSLSTTLIAAWGLSAQVYDVWMACAAAFGVPDQG